MEITGWSLWALVAVVGINTLFIAGICIALFLIHRKVEEALAKAGPVLEKTTETLAGVEAATSRMQERMDRVLDRATELVDHVSERVDTTTAIAEEAVTEPLIGAASLMAGIHRGLRTYSERSSGTDRVGSSGDKGDGTK